MQKASSVMKTNMSVQLLASRPRGRRRSPKNIMLNVPGDLIGPMLEFPSELSLDLPFSYCCEGGRRSVSGFTREFGVAGRETPDYGT